jgi:hypothetical protein
VTTELVTGTGDVGEDDEAETDATETVNGETEVAMAETGVGVEIPKVETSGKTLAVGGVAVVDAVGGCVDVI